MRIFKSLRFFHSGSLLFCTLLHYNFLLQFHIPEGFNIGDFYTGTHQFEHQVFWREIVQKWTKIRMMTCFKIINLILISLRDAKIRIVWFLRIRIMKPNHLKISDVHSQRLTIQKREFLDKIFRYLRALMWKMNWLQIKFLILIDIFDLFRDVITQFVVVYCALGALKSSSPLIKGYFVELLAGCNEFW